MKIATTIIGGTCALMLLILPFTIGCALLFISHGFFGILFGFYLMGIGIVIIVHFIYWVEENS